MADNSAGKGGNPREPVRAGVAESIGGTTGYLLRRSVHVSMVLLPWAYYWHGDSLAMGANSLLDLGWTASRLGAVLVLALGLFEVLRLTLGWQLLGYRRYESKRISGMAWGTCSVGLTLLAVPQYGVQGAALGLPLVWSLSLGDPFMGELRQRLGCTERQSAIAGWLLLLLVWGGSYLWLGTPWWLAVLVPPVCVAAEQLELGWMDDNGSMLLAPLALVLVLSPFIV